MMYVTGSALASMRSHIPKKVGKSDFDKWLKSLKTKVEKVFKTAISTSQRYPLNEHLMELSQSFCKLFYGGDMAGKKYFDIYIFSTFTPKIFNIDLYCDFSFLIQRKVVKRKDAHRKNSAMFANIFFGKSLNSTGKPVSKSKEFCQKRT